VVSIYFFAPELLRDKEVPRKINPEISGIKKPPEITSFIGTGENLIGWLK